MSDITDAQRAITKAEEQIVGAERARDDAYNRLDEALAARGWKRMMGAFDARLYQYRGGNPQPLDAVLEFERSAAA